MNWKQLCLILIPVLAICSFLLWAGWTSWVSFGMGGFCMAVLMFYVNDGKASIISGMFHAVDRRINDDRQDKDGKKRR